MFKNYITCLNSVKLNWESFKSFGTGPISLKSSSRNLILFSVLSLNPDDNDCHCIYISFEPRHPWHILIFLFNYFFTKKSICINFNSGNPFGNFSLGDEVLLDFTFGATASLADLEIRYTRKFEIFKRRIFLTDEYF